MVRRQSPGRSPSAAPFFFGGGEEEEEEERGADSPPPNAPPPRSTSCALLPPRTKQEPRDRRTGIARDRRADALSMRLCTGYADRGSRRACRWAVPPSGDTIACGFPSALPDSVRAWTPTAGKPHPAVPSPGRLAAPGRDSRSSRGPGRRLTGRRCGGTTRRALWAEAEAAIPPQSRQAQTNRGKTEYPERAGFQ